MIGKLIKAAKPMLELTFEVSSGAGAAKPSPAAATSSSASTKAVAEKKKAENLTKKSAADAAAPAPVEPPKKKEWKPEILGVLPVPKVDALATCCTAADAKLRACASQALLSMEIKLSKIETQFGLPEGFELELRVSAAYACVLHPLCAHPDRLVDD